MRSFYFQIVNLFFAMDAFNRLHLDSLPGRSAENQVARLQGAGLYPLRSFGRFQTYPDMILDSETDSGQVMLNVSVGETQHIQTQTTHPGVAFQIILSLLRLKMTGAVHFNDQMRVAAVEIGDEGAYRMLATEFDPQLIVTQGRP